MDQIPICEVSIYFLSARATSVERIIALCTRGLPRKWTIRQHGRFTGLYSSQFPRFLCTDALLLKKKKKKKCYFLLFFYFIFSLHLSEYFSLVWFVISLALFIVNVLYYNMPSKVLNLRKMPCIYYTAVFGIIMELQLSLEEQSGCGIVAKPQTGRRVIYFNFYQQSNSKKVLPWTQFSSKEHTSAVNKVNNFIEERWSH